MHVIARKPIAHQRQDAAVATAGSVTWDGRRLALAAKGWLVFGLLWACIYNYGQSAGEPRAQVSAPEPVALNVPA